MATKIVNLEISERDMSINPRMLRRNGKIPATVYGRGLDSFSVEVDKKIFTHLYYTKKPHLVNLMSNDNKLSALLKNVHVDPRTSEVLNIEFLQVKDDEKVTLSIPLVLENESPAVKKGGILWQLLDEIEIECLPRNIPDKLVYDISRLEDLDISITLADLEYPEGVSPAMSPDKAILKISSPKAEVEEEKPGEVAAEPVAAEA